MDTAVHTIEEPAPHPPGAAPQLRTLLLTDLADSTGLIERLGDGPAGELFRAHDRLVLQLQQAWRGRLIDRSDGMLLLFERPIDGLGFALDYVRGLVALGEERRLELRARAGLHVGEVLTWRNSDEAVSLGAKPLEVEGLAKPMAARLMTLARPGQILLTAVAEPLARRAARELGERGPHLLWKSWGRWRFKGVPDPQQIFEVGEPGIAPLRAPPSTPKAWRDVPLWRRPAMLLAEAAVLALVAVGAWFLTRPQPAIAFHQRDWVVIGDLRNLTGDRRFDDALETALRISLEQSRHVNVMPDGRVREMLGLMRHTPAMVVDRELGSELALRTGARALLLPTVSEIGGQVQVSLEVVDPNTQATVDVESARGRGVDSAIDSVGEVSVALRESLGESLASIRTSAAPAEKVTTSNLDALRAYALGQQAYALHKFDEAEQHFSQALKLDRRFALARIGLARVRFTGTDVGAAQKAMEAALRDADRLSARERLYADAQASLLRWDPDFIGKWVALHKLYPDFHVAAYNLTFAMLYGNRYPEAVKYGTHAAAKQSVARSAALYHRAIAHAALGDFPAAARDFDEVKKSGSRMMGGVHQSLALAAQGKLADAEALLAALGGPSRSELERGIARVAVAADAGRWDEAERRAMELGRSVREPRGPFDWLARTTVLAVAKRTDDATAVRRQAGRLLDQAEAALPRSRGLECEVVANAALYAGYVAAGLGERELTGRALALAEPVISKAPQPVLANMAAIVRAEAALHAGKPETALDLLRPHDGSSALLLTDTLRAEALRGLGRVDEPDRDQPAWRGRAYMEWAAERPPIVETLAR